MNPLFLLPILFALLAGKKGTPSSAGQDFFDITAKSDRKHRQGLGVKRRIMIHQTDGPGSDNPKGWGWVKSHWGVLNNKGIVLIHPLGADIKGSYPDTIAIEVGGQFPGILNPSPDDKEAINFNKKHKKRLNDAQRRGIEEAMRRSLAFMLDQSPGLRPSQVELLAHRQAYASRTFDPGQEVYQCAARAAKRLGMTVRYDYSQDSGKPIPPAWRV